MPKGIYIRTKPVWNKGLTKEIDIRIKKYGENASKTKKGKHYSKRTEFKKGQVSLRKGQKHSLITKEKLSNIFKGSNSSLWKGGISELHDLIRKGEIYREWRITILRRDNFICQECGQKGFPLEVHHCKKSFYKILQEFLSFYSQFSPIEDKETLVRLTVSWLDFWDLNNGITLCNKCHILIRGIGVARKIS